MIDFTSWTISPVDESEVFQARNLFSILSIINWMYLGLGLPMKIGASK